MAESRAERRARRALAQESGEAPREAKPGKSKKKPARAKKAAGKGGRKKTSVAGQGSDNATRPSAGPAHATAKPSSAHATSAHAKNTRKQMGLNTATKKPKSGKTAARNRDVSAPCPVMHECGGCEWLNLPYKKQLVRKQAAMTELFADICKQADIEISPIRGMGVTLGEGGKYPAPRAFRHKAATPFAPGPHGTVRRGFFKRGTHQIIDVPACAVEAPEARRILNQVARVAEEHKIPAYNEDTHTGLLRYAVLRAGWRTDEFMLTLVTAQRDLPRAEEFFDAVAGIDPRIVCLAQNINNRVTNAILGDETRIVRGRESLRDELLDCSFDISPTAFYQTNPEQTELLYQIAIDGMELRSGDVLMDAYCGSGTIGLCAAKQAASAGNKIMLLGVERNPAGVADARKNAELNDLGRCAWFMADDATDYMLDAAANHERVDVLSIDPPRAGSTPEFLEAAIALKPRRIVYISCNPTTQERDLHPLMDAGYRLLSIVPVDMFPHTTHVETVAVLER